MKKMLLLLMSIIMVLGMVACGSCDHSWSDANCLSPKTCSKCGATEGECLGHHFADATCNVPKTCENCGVTEGEPLGHSWEVIENAMTCSICGDVDESVVIELGPLYNVPAEDEADARKKYLNILSQNNVQNEATFLEHNGWIYGQAWNNSGNSQFIKVRTDSSDWTVLDTGFAHHIFIVDNYIYYMKNANDDSGIYKMKTSGEDKQRISTANGAMQVVDRQIYYTDYNYENEVDAEGNVVRVKPEYRHLYKCELDGSGITEIIAKPTFHYYVFEDGILYQDDNDNSSLHVCSLDGKDDIKLNDAISFWPIYDGNYIYYVRQENLSDNTTRSIWRIKPDGSDDQMISDYEVSTGFMMTYEHIYFVYGDDSDRLYRIDKDGSNLTLITQDTNVNYPQLLGNQIKYTRISDDGRYFEGNYFCNYDGSGKWDFLDMK